MHKYSLRFAAAGLSLISASAFAQTSSSSGFGLSVNQTVTAPQVANVNVTVGPLAPSSASSPGTSPGMASVASVNQTFALTSGLVGTSERLQTGLLTSNSTATSTSASATATVNSLSVGIGPTTVLTPFLASIFGLTATTIQSTSTASMSGLTGSTTIADLMITGSGLGGFTFSAAGNSTPAPNTQLSPAFLLALGVSIILNEQIVTGNSITTNAIHVSFNDFLLADGGLKDGDIIVSSTTAAFNAGQTGAVPEPATWAMMLIGFGAMGVSMRRRRQRQNMLQVA